MSAILEKDIVKFWIQDDILFSEYEDPIEMNLINAKKIIELRHKISNGKKQYWCYDSKNIKLYTKEARDYADIHGQDLLLACAAIVHSNIAMAIFNLYIKIKKVQIPFRAFASKEKAVGWLNDIKKKNDADGR